MKEIVIAHLYQKEMNIYGDTGNRLILEKRLQWRGYRTRSLIIGIGDSIPSEVDIIVGGGGQDAGQSKIESDLLKKADKLRSMARDGVVMLMVCGLYQLFGESFTTSEGVVIRGIGVMPHKTIAGHRRLIGNIVVESPFGDIVGYENHSGRTFIDNGAEPLGVVKKGAGNNGKDGFEGCITNNIFGTYMHGPILSKNPLFADELLLRALRRRGVDEIIPLDDSFELHAASVAMLRPR